jgi:16S rRNA (uracil1498-N3)-methyltransferase
MRRILVPQAAVGRVDLPPAQAHHLRDVLRMREGAEIEAFDAAGRTGRGRIASVNSKGVSIQIEQMNSLPADRPSITIAAALPKAGRADWMIEKLGELGVDRFIPLASERGVVLPRGQEKQRRWVRLAEQSARQSGRVGVMRIETLTDLPTVLQQIKSGGVAAWYLSPTEDATPILELPAAPAELILLIGPEGGWSDAEIEAFEVAGILAVRIGQTILRVETAAVAAAAIVHSFLTRDRSAASIASRTERKSS